MTTEDISRSLMQPRKRYSAVRMQQGRVFLDSDWNEHAAIHSEDERRTLVEIVCAKGSPNRGFLVEGPISADETTPGFDPIQTYNFVLADGSFYLGGLRFEIETEDGPETFLNQTDWLQIDADANNLPASPTLIPDAGERVDLVYVRGWEQCVTAVEDSELRERALGGPDTSVRRRRMQRIEILTGVPGSCATAFAQLKDSLTAPQGPDNGSPHPFDAKSCELRSKARLTILPDPAGITEDPCRPSVPGGFLGADNQTLRVQLTATDRFIWGIDNAAPLYRVQVQDAPDDPAGARRKIKFLTSPRDQAAQPLAGQAVEIVPWGSLLPNKEKVAEFQGKLFTVATSYDPADGSLTIAESVPGAWLEWLASHSEFWSERDPAEQQQYLYLRLWTGGSGEATAPDHAFVPGTSVALQGTGLSVVFSDNGLPGSYWVAAARPHTPDVVVPWELLDSAAPMGPRYFFAPLALIRWSVDANNQPQAQVQDCRERFQPLCEARGCCTVTVGDGVSSTGLFESIEAAIDYLPPEGGRICLLPGVHETRTRIVGRRNITITGCDKQTRVIPRREDRTAPLFELLDSRCITLEHMVMVQLGGTAVRMGASRSGRLEEVTVEHNRIVAFDNAVRVLRGQDIEIRHNRIRMLDKDGAGVAILMLAEDALIERNDIGVMPARLAPPPDVPDDDDTPDPIDPCADLELVYLHPTFLAGYLTRLFGLFLADLREPFKALGGIRIAAASERVKILDNTILGGAGDGITLGGSGLEAAQPDDDDTADAPGFTVLSTFDRAQGVVREAGTGVAGVSMMLTGENGTTTTVVSGSDGYFSAPVAAGRYTAAVVSPGRRIQAINTSPVGGAQLNDIALVQDDVSAPDELVAFLYEIQIDRNEIGNMGLSGIGIPAPVSPATVTNTLSTRTRALTRIAELLGYPIVSLGIHRNHIHNCLRNPFDDPLRELARKRGLGGISLGFCEDVAIDGNRIEQNGLNPANPACGIFIGFGDKVVIDDNRVLDNRRTVQDVELTPGIRAGIAVVVLAIGVDDLLVGQDAMLDNGRHAGRIHRNIVHQPVGHALRIVALGPLSVCDNRLNTELAGPAALEQVSGTMLVLNLGGSGRLPEGTTLVNDNQSRLARGTSMTAQLVWTLDDLGYSANQSSAFANGLQLTDAITLFVNTILIGKTLRATDSRFKELSSFGQEGDLRISLISRSALMNNTSNNQGDHCIFPFDSSVIDAGNQELDNTRCPRVQGIVATPIARFPAAASFSGR